MAYDGSLKFDTRVDSSGFKSGIEKLGSIAKAGLKVAAAAIGAVSGAFGAAVLSGVKYNSQMEQYITSFGTMLGSAEEATKLVNNLKEMGAKTPFETSDLAKASQTLLAFGTSAEDLLPTLQMLGDVSQGNKERFDSLTLAFAQVGSAGKLSGQDLLQFVNAGFNPLNEISKMTGESMAELKERMSAGGVSAEEVAEAFKHATSEGGQFYQAMEAQSQTFNGQMSTLKDNAMSFIGELTLGVTNTLKDSVLPTVNGWLEELQSAFTSNGVEGVVTAFGSILADACTKLAESAPGVVELAVGFIQSFMKGIGDNAPQLIQAAKQIVSALVDGLIKLLPSEVQKPVKETVNILKRSFESGGLRNAINTVSNILKNLGKIVTNLAKTILPPLAKAVDFLGKNIKIILPLVTSVVAGIKAFNIAKTAATAINSLKASFQTAALQLSLFIAQEGAAAVATSASAAALTAKEVVVGTLTGKISLVTAAQWLWNTAIKANPIGAVIGLVAALAAGIGLLCVALDDGKSGEEQLAEANQALGDSFGDVGQAAADFYDGIQNAESRLSQFNDTLFASAEEQQALQDNMQEVQDGITTICKTAAEERRGYTEQEILQLDEYFAKMREIADAQLAIQEAKSDAIRQQAVNEAQAFKGSLGEYQLTAQEWIKTAQDQADQQISLIEEQTTTELTLLNQKYGNQANMANEAYKAEYDELMARKDASIQAANEEVGAVSSAYQNGYLQRTEHLQAFLDKTKELKGQEEAEEQRYNDRIKELKDELKAIEDDETLSYNDKARLRYMKQDEIQRETDGHYAKLSEIQDKYNEGLTDDVKDELGSWMAMLAQTEQYGGYISEENKKTFDGILDKIDEMPPETRDAMKNAMSPMLDEMKNAEPGLFEKAAGIAGGILNRLKSAFDIHSPSRKTRKIFRQVMEGAEEGFEDEEPKLLNQTAGIADDILKRFQLSKLDVSGMVQKMKAAVAAESYRMSASLSASGNYEVVRDSRYGSETGSNVSDGRYVAEIHVDLEGREVARATAPFMGEQLAWEG